jgi:hypothetical protein
MVYFSFDFSKSFTVQVSIRFLSVISIHLLHRRDGEKREHGLSVVLGFERRQRSLRERRGGVRDAVKGWARIDVDAGGEVGFAASVFGHRGGRGEVVIGIDDGDGVAQRWRRDREKWRCLVSTTNLVRRQRW